MILPKKGEELKYWFPNFKTYRGLVGKTGREMVGAALACYGPRVTIIFFDDEEKAVKEATLVGTNNHCFSYPKTIFI